MPLSEQKNCILHKDFESLQNNYLKMETRLKALEAAYKRPAYLPVTESSNKSLLFQKSSSHQHSYSQGEQIMFQQFLRNGTHSSNQNYAQKSLVSNNSRDNTILIPPSTQDFVERVMPDYSPLRKVARVTHITTDSLELLIDQGGGEVGWVVETGKRDETEAPELTKLNISTHEMFARPRASQKLLDDMSIDLENWLAQKIAWQMGLMETQAFINGDGKCKPKGFLSYPKTDLGKPVWGKVEVMSSFVEGKIEDADVLLEVFHSLKPEYLQGACWVMSRATLAMVRKIKDKDGQYLWLPHVSQEGSSTLLGYPVLICDAMPSPAKESLSIAFGNFKHGYQIVERQDIQVLRDPYSAKPYVEFYATKRVGGDVMNFEALKLIQF